MCYTFCVTNEEIKEKLLSLSESETEFSVIQSGKMSKKVNGLYKSDTHEIILHNKNFKSDSELLYTAIHEYAHHLENEKWTAQNGENEPPKKRPHTKSFYFRFNELLEKAKQTGVYKIDISSSPELVELTQRIKNEYIKEGAVKMIEFGKLLIKAHELCVSLSIRYEDYVERVLCLPRRSERSIVKVAMHPENPEIGFDNMKMISSLKNKEDKKEALSLFQKGLGPVAVNAVVAQKQNAKEEADEKEKLLREKGRIEKTISLLQKRLELLENRIENL